MIQLEKELQKLFVACKKNYAIPTTTTRIATVNRAVKWRFNPRKRIEFERGVSYGISSKNFHWAVNTHFVDWISSTQIAFSG
jgi:hypothetical protein